MKSEFDTYRNLTFIPIHGGHFCLEKQRFIKSRTMDKTIDDTEKLAEQSPDPQTDSQNEGVIAKLELSIYGYKYTEN